MAQCVRVVNNLSTQYVVLDNNTPIDQCNLLLFTQSDYVTLSGFTQLFAEYFRFDLTNFETIVGSALVLFVMSFGIGKVLNAFRKV